MALGGGTFIAQNKVLPGAYINFVSAASASSMLSDRGIATIPLVLDWGAQGAVMELAASDFPANSLKLFGYEYTAPQLKPLRDLFRNVRLAYLFRLGTGGANAENIYAKAKYAGKRGNDLKIVIAANADNASLFDVLTYLGSVLVDSQAVGSATDLTDNDFVTWKTGVTLAQTAGTPLTGGASPAVVNGDYQAYLELIEGYSFNGMGCPSNDSSVIGLFTAFTKRLRDEQGVKFQCVVYSPDNNSDYEGVVDITNTVTDDGADAWSTVYWATGVIAGTAVNRSATNRLYDGEFTVDVNYTQAQLENAIKGGKFTFHRVGSDVRVLSDINSLITVTADKGEVFRENQTIRVIDQIANDIAVLFNTKYLGVVPNDAAGRISLWADIVLHHEQLQEIRAIENFVDSNVTVEQGDTRRSVVVSDIVTIVNAMTQLYMTVMVA